MSDESTRIDVRFDARVKEENEVKDSIEIEDFQYTQQQIKTEQHGERNKPTDVTAIESRPFQCVICEKVFDEKKRLRLHIPIHLPDDSKRFQCDTCGKGFLCKSNLINHIFVHLPEYCKPIQCNFCDVRFSFKSHLQNHMSTHLSEDNKQYRCERCHARFWRKSALKKHVNGHIAKDNNERFECGICKKIFLHKYTTMQHIKSHLSEGNEHFQIELEDLDKWCRLVTVSTKSVPQTENVRAKRSKPTPCTCIYCVSGEKKLEFRNKHKCNMCDKIFEKMATFKDHYLRSHTRDKPFVCGACGKEFVRSDELNRHKRIHTGEKRFECNTCPKKFMRTDHLAKHILTHKKKK